MINSILKDMETAVIDIDKARSFLREKGVVIYEK
jgi:hypothetical protein